MFSLGPTLGQGGAFSRAYRCTKDGQGRVAKVIATSNLDAGAEARLLELTSLKSIQHPHVLDFDCGFAQGAQLYLLWEPAEEKLRELTRQPPARYLDTVSAFEATASGVAVLAVDPSRGSLLNALTETPNATERVQQGGYVGYTIITLGVCGSPGSSFASSVRMVSQPALARSRR